MQILMINQDWFAEEWRREGHRVVTVGLAPHLDVLPSNSLLHIDTIIQECGEGFMPDRIVVHDNSSPIYFTGFDETSIPTLFYSVDTHHHLDLHRFLYEVFDGMCVAQKDYIEAFHSFGQYPTWLPLWASRYVEPSLHKEFDSVFVGSMNPTLNPERVEFFRILAQQIPIHITTGEYWKIFPFSEIVVNQTVKLDLNFRVFEAMMCGGLLLTERTENGLFDLFEDNRHFITYAHHDVDEAAAKVRSFLHDREKARLIGQRGREEILRSHLAQHRAQQMMMILTNLTKKKSSQKFFSSMVNFVILGQRLAHFKTEGAGLAYLQALKCVENALIFDEPVTDAILSSLLGGLYGYDRMTRSDRGTALLFALYEKNQDNRALQYACVRDHLNRNRIDDAKALARKISVDSPELTFELSERFVSTILHDVITE